MDLNISALQTAPEKRCFPFPTMVYSACSMETGTDVYKRQELYSSCGKQVIIALDKQDSYSEKTSRLLGESAVLRLSSNGQELFGRSWG